MRISFHKRKNEHTFDDISITQTQQNHFFCMHWHRLHGKSKTLNCFADLLGCSLNYISKNNCCPYEDPVTFAWQFLWMSLFLFWLMSLLYSYLSCWLTCNRIQYLGTCDTYKLIKSIWTLVSKSEVTRLLSLCKQFE